jgi:hypothetical protein
VHLLSGKHQNDDFTACTACATTKSQDLLLAQPVQRPNDTVHRLQRFCKQTIKTMISPLARLHLDYSTKLFLMHNG